MLSLFLSLLGISAAAVFILILLTWMLSVVTNDGSVIDLVWGAGFAIVSALCLMFIAGKQPLTPYVLLLGVLPIVWALRYSVYIWHRNIGHGEDPRYTAMREGKTQNEWRWHMLTQVYPFQAAAMLLVALPIILGIASGTYFGTEIGIIAYIGTSIWAIGVLFEGIGDWQLSRFKKRRAKLGSDVTGKVMDKGLWRYTRHPNYFGNATLWWGIFLVACAAPWGWLSFIGPAFMTLALVKLTGAAHLERTLSQRPEYADYMQRTSGFIPMLPRRGRKLRAA